MLPLSEAACPTRERVAAILKRPSGNGPSLCSRKTGEGPERGPGRCTRALSFYAAGIGFCCLIYPLTAPAVRPETIRRWKIRTSITSGTVTTTAAAAWAP